MSALWAAAPLETVSFPHDAILSADAQCIFSHTIYESSVHAYNIIIGNSLILSLPMIPNSSDSRVTCANSIPDGFVVGARYISHQDEKRPKGNNLYAVIFYDRNGVYKSHFETTKLEFLAASVWDAGNVVLAWRNRKVVAGKREAAFGLSIFDRQGKEVLSLGKVHTLREEDYIKSQPFTLTNHHLYWRENQLYYIDPDSGEMTAWDKKGNLVYAKKLDLGSVPVKGGVKYLESCFKAGSAWMAVVENYDSNANSHGNGFIADLKSPEIFIPLSSQSGMLHWIGNDFFIEAYQAQGLKHLVQLTEENWKALFQH